jgi:hypothetical protein
MIVYISPKKEEVLKRSPDAVKLTISERDKNAFVLPGFDPHKFFNDSKQYFIASAFKNERGEESDISNIITVIKQHNGSYTFK